MAAPFESVLTRGAIFLWHRYERLDDPALAGQSKAKFIVVLSSSPQDDPIIYLLTTFAKPKHANPRFHDDLMRIPANAYGFFPQETIIDVAEAGQLDMERDRFMDLYDRDAVTYKGKLSADHERELMEKIRRCPRVVRRVKSYLGLA